MSRDLRLYCEDILVSCEKVLRYTEEVSFEAFIEDEIRFDAVLRNLQIIGEAVKQVPQDMRDRYSIIEWRKIVGLRDILAHAYFSLEDETIWDIVENKVPELRSQIQIIIQQEFMG